METRCTGIIGNVPGQAFLGTPVRQKQHHQNIRWTWSTKDTLYKAFPPARILQAHAWSYLAPEEPAPAPKNHLMPWDACSCRLGPPRLPCAENKPYGLVGTGNSKEGTSHVCMGISTGGDFWTFAGRVIDLVGNHHRGYIFLHNHA